MGTQAQEVFSRAKMEWQPHYFNHVAGILYGLAFWIWIDAIVQAKQVTQQPYASGAAAPKEPMGIHNPGFYIPLILSTIVMIMINTVSYYKISGQEESSAGAARALVIGTYVVLFGSWTATIWICAAHNGADDDEAWWPFIANIIAVFLVIASTTVFRFAPYAGESSSPWG